MLWAPLSSRGRYRGAECLSKGWSWGSREMMLLEWSRVSLIAPLSTPLGATTLCLPCCLAWGGQLAQVLPRRT